MAYSQPPALGALVLSLLLAAASGVRNSEIIRTVDLTGSITRVALQISAEELSGRYVVSWNEALGQRLAFQKVSVDGEQLPFERIKDSDGLINYEVKVKGSSAKIQVDAAFTEALQPFPEEIFQSESQAVVFEDSHYVASTYPTTTQTTTFNLASTVVESYSRLAPSSLSGSVITAGPYKDVPAKSFSAFRVHFENNSPFAMAKVAIKEIEVSHWGNVAHEEYYEVQNAGAKLKGGFSRFEYQFNRDKASFRRLRAMLPRAAHHIYYRDMIGNISSSDLRFYPDGVELSVDMRFPLFGGWKTVFYQGYNVPIQELVTKSGDRLTLTVPFSVPYYELWTKDLTVKVILPEHARNVQVNVPFEVEESRTSRLTFLDTSLSGGRPVITLKKTNVVPEHNQPLVITYDFKQFDMLWEPMYLVLAFLAFYVICMVAVRVDLRIAYAAEKEQQKEKTL